MTEDNPVIVMKMTASDARTSSENSSWSKRRHLFDSSELSKAEVKHLLNRAAFFKEKLFGKESGSKRAIGERLRELNSFLLGRTSANLFYENSTRTRLSFELASKHLGMQVLNLDVSRSSVQKGESLEDTGRTLAAMGIDVIVQRHSVSGSAAKIAEATENKVHIINAGEGVTDHPTQGLLDLFTMLETIPEHADLSGKKVVIVGDILHSRVASTNLSFLPMFGAELILVGPEQLLPQKLSCNNVSTNSNLDEALTGADFVMAIRPQFERQEEGVFGSVDKYISNYQVNHERLKNANANVKVCAPGPINRDIEISGKLASDKNLSLIETQVQNGVVMRMAVIEALCSTD